MKQKVFSRALSAFLITFSLSIAIAAPEPLQFEHSLNLADFRGDTPLNAMIIQGGIKENLDTDYLQEYEVAPWNVIDKAVSNFDTKIVKRVLGAFDYDKEEFKKFTRSIEGQTFSPADITRLISKNYDGSGNIYALSHFYAMASGAGTLVVIDNENYYYNFGYKSGEESDDVKSGRSYGAGPLHNANDASDVMYLNEIEDYVQSTDDPLPFYKAIMDVITNCDPSGFSNLSDIGQTAATDFVAIYTAELDRHIMVDLHNSIHPWKNDLAEATFLAVYTVNEGKLMKDGVLKKGRMREYWEMSKISDGSGIGITRKDRRKLQRRISEYVREHHAEVAEEIDQVTKGPRDDGDLFRAVTESINNYSTQSHIRSNNRRLTNAVLNLLKVVGRESSQITEAIEAQ